METIKQALTQDKRLIAILQLTKKYPKSSLFLVGGMVRDLLLKRSSKDYDFVISGVKPNILENYLKKNGRVSFVGKGFGVYKFIPKSDKKIEPIDIALPRTEHSLYYLGGYREFKVSPDYRLPIKQDLARRDFTINALAWDVRRHRLIDPMGGLSDLAVKKIKAVGDPEKRFREDYSRMLRGLRFAVQLNFEIEDETFFTIRKMIGYLGSAKIPREIIAKELGKALENNALRALDALEVSGALRVLIPELLHGRGCEQSSRHHSEGDVWTHTRLALESLLSPAFHKQFMGQKPDLELIIATLLHDIGKPYTAQLRAGNKLTFYGHEVVGSRLATDICQRLNLSSYQGKVDCQNINWLIRHHLIITHADLSQIKTTTLEKYFISSGLGDKLFQLIFADRLASLSDKLKPSLGNFYDAFQLVEEIKKTGYKRKKKNQPRLLVNGHEIIKMLSLKPGPKIGTIINRVRVAQLGKKIRTKKQAENFIKRVYGKSNKSRRKRSKAG